MSILDIWDEYASREKNKRRKKEKEQKRKDKALLLDLIREHGVSTSRITRKALFKRIEIIINKYM